MWRQCSDAKRSVHAVLMKHSPHSASFIQHRSSERPTAFVQCLLALHFHAVTAVSAAATMSATTMSLHATTTHVGGWLDGEGDIG